MTTIKCRCEHEFEIDFPTSLEMDSKEVLDGVKNKDLFYFTCPECKSLLTPEIEFRLTLKDFNRQFYFCASSDRHFDFLQSFQVPKGVDRIVFGYQELIEKIDLLQAQLDDEIIEYLKIPFYEKNTSDELQLFFLKKENDFLIFNVFNPMNEKIGVTKFPETAYTDYKNSLDKQKIIKLFKPFYINAMERIN